MNRVLYGLLLISLVVFLPCTVFLSCTTKKTGNTDPSIPVNLMSVTRQDVVYYDTYPSTTQALNQVSLLAQVQGYITGIYFKEGSFVKKGQKLYEIDNRVFKASYDAASANLRVAQGNLLQAKQDAERYTYLNSYKAVAKQLYDHAMIALSNAQSSVKSSEEAKKTAAANLTYSTIKAPFDGTMGFSQVKLGNVVSVGSTVLNTISSNNPMAVDFLINEKQVDWFEKLQKNLHSAPDSLFTLVLPNGNLYSRTGKISVIDRAVDPQTGSLKVRLVFPNPDNSLKVGMSCVVRVHNQDTKPQLFIPNKAVVEQMGEYFVFVARDSVLPAAQDASGSKTADNTRQKHQLIAIEKKVQVGQIVGANVVIKHGIEPGEKIVVDGVQSLHDGSPITTANKVAPSQGKKR